MASDAITYTQDDKLAIIRIDDGHANALNYAAIDALLAALTRAEHEATAAVIAGRPDHFSVGFDSAEQTSSHDAAVRLVARGSELLIRLYSTQIPLVVACTGGAISAGALIVLTGDVRIGAVGDFAIGLDEITHGKAVPALAVELARARLTPVELLSATLTSRLYDFEHAMRAGFLDALAPAADVVTRAVAEARALGALAGDAYAATKLRVRGPTIEHMRG